MAAAHLIRHAGVATLDAPAYIARLRYPIYYLEPLLASTNPREIDPLIFFALIRQESLFNTYATAAGNCLNVETVRFNIDTAVFSYSASPV